MSNNGLAPRVLAEGTGKTACNLALCCGPTPVSYFLLRRALEAGARPSAIMVEAHPAVLAHDPRFSVRFWPHLLTLGETFDLCAQGNDPALFGAIAVSAVLPSARNREQIRDLFTQALRGEINLIRIANLQILRNKRLNNGGALQPIRPFDGAISDTYRSELLPDAWAPSRSGDRYLRRFLSLAEAEKIPVFLQIPPFCPALRRERSRRGLDRAYSRYLALLQSQYRSLWIIDGQGAEYGPEMFYDPVHMNRRGAVAYSSAVADVLAHSLSETTGRGRWINLPSHDPSSKETLEDLEQSRDIVMAIPGTIRR